MAKIKKAVVWIMVIIVAVLFLAGIVFCVCRLNIYFMRRIGSFDNYLVKQLPIEYFGTSISDEEIRLFLKENETDIKNRLPQLFVDPVGEFTILESGFNYVTVGQYRHTLNRDVLCLPIVNSDGYVFALLSLSRSHDGLRYDIEDARYLADALGKYPGEDLVMITIDSHLTTAVIAPDNEVYFYYGDVDVFEDGVDYYGHFKTEYNVLNLPHVPDD